MVTLSRLFKYLKKRRLDDCDSEIFEKGEPIATLNATPNAAEGWVRSVAKKAVARVDWHYSGAIAQVLHLGDSQSRKRVEEAIKQLAPKLKGKILKLYKSGEPGLYRKGVTQKPEDAVATFYVDGHSEYLSGDQVKKEVNKLADEIEKDLNGSV
jgi:hypothetical protein